MLTPEQREAAIEQLSIGYDGANNWKHMCEAERADTRHDSANALDALLSGFVVIAKDDVSIEYGCQAPSGMVTWRSTTPHLGSNVSHRVTRWEPTTKEDTDAK